MGKDARIIDYVRLSNFYGDIDEVRIVTEAVDGFDIVTSAEEPGENVLIPVKYNLYQNYPNPFNPVTNIRFDVPFDGLMSLRIYSILGQVVRTLADGFTEKGRHTVTWDGKNESGIVLPSGVYFYELRAEGFVEIKKMVFLK